jgi:quercetin dioxygenase-like cupin family protein
MTAHDDDRSVAPKRYPAKASKLEAATLVDVNEEIIRLQKEVSTNEELEHRTKMLVKHPEFRIVLITMNSGSQWAEHKTNSRISMQPLQGHIRLFTPDGNVDLREGQLLTLDPGVPHSVEALEESAFLLTLSGSTA